MGFVVGVVYGAAGTIAHAFQWMSLPIGLVLAIVGSAALLVAVRALTADRWAALATGLGMMVSVLLFTGTGPGGSVIVPSGDLDAIGGVNLGSVWTVSVPILVAIVVAWPEHARLRARDTN